MQTFGPISTYIITLAIAALIPGPGMTGILFKTISKGPLQGLIMLLGLMTGDLIFLGLSLLCMTYIAHLDPDFFNYLVIFSCLYLTYLAYKFWIFDPHLLLQMGETAQKSHYFSAYPEGLLLTLSNPKTISFYLAWVPVIFAHHSNHGMGLIIILSGVTVFTLAMVGAIYIVFSTQMKQKLTHPKIQKMLLKSISILMYIIAFKMLCDTLFEIYSF